MKTKNTKIVCFQIFLLFGLLYSVIQTTTPTAAAFSNEETQIPMLKALVDHGPIVIEYDSNFTDYGFSGIGTPGDPYRIENYNITVTSDYPILFGGETSKHFVIQDCFLKTDTNYGIFLGKYFDMADDTVKVLNNVIIAENNAGITMHGGKNALLSGNTITSYDDGMDIYDSAGFLTISNNVITTEGNIGIYLDNCSSATITYNTCVGNSVGISLNSMDDTDVTHNNCSENENGIEISNDSNNHRITSNYLTHNTDQGISIGGTINTVFTNNLFQKNTNYAIRFFAGSDNNILHHNAFVDNNEGGVQASDDGANNVWFDTISLEGNYYSDWVSGSYSIDGTSGSVDPYPLNAIPEIPEFSNMSLAILLVTSIMAIPVITRIIKKKEN